MVRRAVTLVEMLIALTMTLIVLGATVTMFGMIGESVNDTRSTIEMSDRLRSATMRLRADLAGATVQPMDVWVRPEENKGYFAIVEGPGRDAPATIPSPANDTTIFGDSDDMLLFTTRSEEGLFVGKNGSGTIQSPYAEVGWFLEPEFEPGGTTVVSYTLYRRVLLVAPSAGTSTTTTYPNLRDFYNGNDNGEGVDVSVHLDSTNGRWVPNTLADLTVRENRFGQTGAFGIPDPSPFASEPYGDTNGNGKYDSGTDTFNTGSTTPLHDLNGNLKWDGSPRIREDIILTNVLAFDVKVWDPKAPIFISGSDAVVPSDPGWSSTDYTNYLAGTKTAESAGAYVDLNFLNTFPLLPKATGYSKQSLFGHRGINTAKGRLATPTSTVAAMYDTWSFHYEANGADDDGDINIDEGTDGIDQNDAYGADDNGEEYIDANQNGAYDHPAEFSPDLDTNGNGRFDPSEKETAPPYNVPLRGIQVKLRVYEPDSRQIREVTIVQNFMPE